MLVRQVRRVASSPATPVAVVLVAVLAFAVRLDVLHRAGYLSVGTYDDGVHFSAAVALLHGRLPYRDVLFLQPPGMLLVLSPFAALAQLVGDAKAFGGARVAFCLLGAVNAALVVVLLRRAGVFAALTGGAVYAVFGPAVYVARTLTLEPVGTAATLLSLLAADRARSGAARWWLVAGALAGAAVGVKIWYVVPLAVLLLFAAGGRLRFLLGAAAAGLAVYLPFFAAAPAPMWQQVVLAQLGRAPSSNGTTRRVEAILGTTVPGGDTHSALLGVSAKEVAVVLGLAVLGAAVAAARDPAARVFVALLLGNGALLLAGPSFLQHYTALTAAPLALVVGAGTGRLLRHVAEPVAAAVVALLVVGLVAGLSAESNRHRYDRTPPVAALRGALQHVHGCVTADDPTMLIVTNRLSTDLADGCAFQADPSGVSYVIALRTGVADRIDDPVFQREVVAYLHSGAAYFLVRGNGLQLDDAASALLHEDRVIGGSGRWALRATPS